MEYRTCIYYTVFSIVINCLLAKPFSLNEIIDAEAQQNQAIVTTTRPHSDLIAETGERFSLNKILTPSSQKPKKFKEIEKIIARAKKISPLKYRKTFQIKSPLKPKKLKRTSKLRYKRKNQSVKREINSNEKLNEKYIPLLKSIGMLFDNLLNTDTSGSYEVKTPKHKRNRYDSDERDRVVCTCARKSDIKNSKNVAQQEAVVPTPNLTTEISSDTEYITVTETTTEAADITPVIDVSGIRQHQNVPILLSGDTFSSQRDDNGVSERSSTTHNRGIERNIAWNHGDSKYTARFGENGTDTQSDEETTHCSTRDDASCDGAYRHGPGNRDNTRSAILGITTDKDGETAEDESSFKILRDSYEPKREDKLEIGRDEAKSPKPLSKLVRRLRGFVHEDKITPVTEPIQSEEVYKESIINVTHNSTGHKRITDRSCIDSTENQKVRPGNEALTSDKGLPRVDDISTQNNTNKTPVVMIIDGYSVTRHKNGENKLSKKAIHVHS